MKLFAVILCLLFVFEARAQTYIYLRQGVPSPFTGHLYTTDSSRSMTVDRKDFDLLKSELQVCLDNRTQYDEVSESTWLGMGFLAGLLSGIILSNALK